MFTRNYFTLFAIHHNHGCSGIVSLGFIGVVAKYRTTNTSGLFIALQKTRAQHPRLFYTRLHLGSIFGTTPYQNGALISKVPERSAGMSEVPVADKAIANVKSA